MLDLEARTKVGIFIFWFSEVIYGKTKLNISSFIKKGLDTIRIKTFLKAKPES